MGKIDIGFMLINIENNEYYNTMFSNINKLIESNRYSNIVVFNSQCNLIETYNVPILHLSHAKFFDGRLFLFDTISAIMSQGFTNLKQKILYCNDMPWIKNRSTSYMEWNSIYSDLDFITTNTYLYDIYHMLWKQPLNIMESFNYEQIQQIL